MPPAMAKTTPRSGQWPLRRRPVSPGSGKDHPPIQPSPLLRCRSSIRLWKRRRRRGLRSFAFNDTSSAAHRLQPVPEFFGDRAGIDTVTNEPCLDEDDDLGSRLAAGGVAKQVAEKLDFAKARYARPRLLVTLADQTGEQHSLTADHRHSGVHAALRNGRRQRLLVG